MQGDCRQVPLRHRCKGQRAPSTEVDRSSSFSDITVAPLPSSLGHTHTTSQRPAGWCLAIQLLNQAGTRPTHHHHGHNQLYCYLFGTVLQLEWSTLGWSKHSTSSFNILQAPTARRQPQPFPAPPPLYPAPPTLPERITKKNCNGKVTKVTSPDWEGKHGMLAYLQAA